MVVVICGVYNIERSIVARGVRFNNGTVENTRADVRATCDAPRKTAKTKLLLDRPGRRVATVKPGDDRGYGDVILLLLRPPRRISRHS